MALQFVKSTAVQAEDLGSIHSMEWNSQPSVTLGPGRPMPSSVDIRQALTSLPCMQANTRTDKQTTLVTRKSWGWWHTLPGLTTWETGAFKAHIV